jgi:MtN3 and saliva related transmembrane protein
MMNSLDSVTILGLIAGAFTTVAFVPQVIRTWRSKSARDLSLAMVSLNATGVLLWLIYGIFTKSLPLIIANTITFVLVSTVLILAITRRKI